MSNDKYLDKIDSKKNQNLKLYNILKIISDDIGMTDKTLKNIGNCSNIIALASDYECENYKKIAGNSCKNRFCPICSYSRACKNALHIKLMLDYLQQEYEYEFLFLTLTVPNCSGEELRETIKYMNSAFKLMFKYKRISSICNGYIKKLELTYNEIRDDYHPHFHVLIAVNKSYFSDTRYYISHTEFLNLWKKAMKNSSITQVNVKKAKKETVALELAKYISKDSNYLYSPEVFKNIYNGLRYLKEFSYSGAFKDARELLKNGSLDKFKDIDNINWYWFISHTWDKEKYQELNKRELTLEDFEYYKLNGLENRIELD